MMQKAKGALAVGAVGLAMVVVLAVDAQVTSEKKKVAPDLRGGLVAATREKEQTVDKLLRAFGPALREQLTAGREVNIPGVGSFRVVKVEAYKDLIDGRPGVVPARNYVEFVAAGEVNAAANAPGAVPARTVPPYEFKVNPNAAPGIRNDGSRAGRTRSR